VVRHLKDGRSYHLLPGGGVEAGETIGAALVREVLEETGFTCELAAPLFINDSVAPDGSRHVVQLTFLAHVTGGSLRERPEDARVAGAEVVTIEALPGLDLRPPMAEAITEAVAAGYCSPARYLGQLWSEIEAGITGTGGTPATDG
jgi:8-oxo-dGTP diphosphatase